MGTSQRIAWSGTPVFNFVTGQPATVQLSSYLSNPLKHAVTYTVNNDGPLPAGVTLSPSGAVSWSGSGTAPGTYNKSLRFRATDTTVTYYVNSPVCPITIKAPVVVKPAAPVNVTASPLSGSSIRLAWAAGTGGDPPVSYRVYRSSVAGGPYTMIANPTASPYDDIGLPSSTQRWYYLTAIDAQGDESTQSLGVTATTAGAKPPLTYSATARDQTTIRLAWTLDPSGATASKVDIDYSEDGVTFSHLYGAPAAPGYFDDNFQLSPGEQRWYTLATQDTNNNLSARTPVITATTLKPAPPPTPVPPINVTAVAVSAVQINLSWAPGAGGSTPVSYNVYRATAAAGPYALRAPNVTATSYQDIGLTSGTQYWYCVTAVDANNAESTQSLSANATTALTPKPPIGVTAVAQSSSTIRLAWTLDPTGTVATKVRIYASNTGQAGSFTQLTEVTPPTASYDDTSLNASTQRWYQVSSLDATGAESALTPVVTATTQALPKPVAPTNVAANALTSVAIRLTWAAGAGGSPATAFRIYRAATLGGVHTLYATTPDGSTFSFDDTGLSQGQTFWYYLTAVDANGQESPDSLEVSAKTTAPAVPVSVAVQTVSATTLKISWVPGTGGSLVTDFHVYRSDSAAGPFVLVGEATASPYLDATLAAGQTKYYRVTACDVSDQESAPSAVAYGTTTAALAPSVPVNVSAVAQSANAIRIAWSAGAAGVSDSFPTSAVGTTLPAYKPSVWSTPTGGTPCAIRQSETFAGSTNSAFQVSQANAVLEPAHYVRVFTHPQQNATAGGALRIQGSNNNFYYMSCNPSTLKTKVGQYVNGVDTEWNSPGIAFALGDTLEFRADATAGTFYLVKNGTVIETYTGKTALSGGGAGAFAYQSGTIGAASIEIGNTSGSIGAPTPTEYRVYSAASSSGPFSKIAAPTSSPYDDTSLTAGQTRYYQVSAFDSVSGLESPKSVTVSATTVTQYPAIPVNLVVTSLSQTTLRLNWQAGSGGAPATGYKVYRATASTGPFTQIGTPTSTTFDDTTLTAGTTRYYRVTAVDAQTDESNPSAIAYGTTQAALTPAIPVNLTANGVSQSTISLAWAAGSGGSTITQYRVYRATSSAGPFTQVGTATGTAYSDTTLAASQTRYYQVSAFDGTTESNKSVTAFATTLAATSNTWATQTPTYPPCFTGMAGHGYETAGGNGTWNGSAAVRANVNTQVIHVTNLNDSGTGSLRAACQASGPRVVVFDTSGRITLLSDIQCYNDNLTIAGETAPAPGITVRGATLAFKGNDQVHRHLHLRPGDRDENGNVFANSARERDGFSFGPESSGKSTRCVMDHCSISWACDENIQIWASSGGIPNGLTVSRCLIGEGLYHTNLPEMANDPYAGYGPLFGPSCDNATFIGNLLACNVERNPLTRGKHLSWINNVHYAWVNFNIDLQSESQVTMTDIVGNVFITGVTNPSRKPVYARGTEAGSLALVSGAKIYMRDNRLGSNAGNVTLRSDWDTSLIQIGSGLTQAGLQSSTPVATSPGVVATDSGLVYNLVKNEVGAFAKYRDATDTRIVNNVINNTGAIPDTVAAAGGWVSVAVNTVNHSTAPILAGDPIPPSGTGQGTWNEVMASGRKRGEEWCDRLAARLIP